MNSKAVPLWIPLERIQSILQPEVPILLIFLSLVAYIVYKTLLRRISKDRHLRLRELFKNLSFYLIVCAGFTTLYFGLEVAPDTISYPLERLMSYVGLFAVVTGAMVFVKVSRILVFEYLFLGHMREDVPVLLVNIFILILSLFVGGWVATEIFNVKLAPLLATSAFASVILGLALQDTLGNLFSGIAMQFDRSYEIGDWIEIQSGPNKWIGKVTEVTWRATLLTGLTDESIIVPNRIMGQSEISNFTNTRTPICRVQIFKLPYGTPLDRARRALLDATTEIENLLHHPEPLVLVSESHESWITCRLVYFIKEYGSQWTIANQVIERAIHNLTDAGISIAKPRLDITKSS